MDQEKDIRRQKEISLQLVWLTLVTLLALLLVAATAPKGRVVDAEFARDVGGFAASLEERSITSFNRLRGSLAADMVFLLAYGWFLRQSLLFAPRHRWTGLARHATMAAMVADATENVAALTVLRHVESGTSVHGWIFDVMNAAAVTKWALVGLILLFLARRWRERAPEKRRVLHYVALVAGWSFALSGVASIAVAATFPFGLAASDLRSFLSMGAFGLLGFAGLLQFRLLDMIGLALRLLSLARVPILVLLIAAGFGPLALGAASSLLGAILDVRNSIGIGVVTAGAIVLAYACVTQINLVRAYGDERTSDLTLRPLRDPTLGRLITWTALVAVGSLLFSIGLSSLWISIQQELAGIIVGLVVAFAFLFTVEWLAVVMTGVHDEPERHRVTLPFLGLPKLATWLGQAYLAEPPEFLVSLKKKVRERPFARRTSQPANGYIGPDGRLQPGHSFALIQFGLTALVYVGWILWKAFGTVSRDAELWVPTAASVVLLLLLNSWGLSALTFFFDRYRVPLFTVMAALTAITGSRACTDYEVETKPTGETYRLASPGQVLEAFKSPIVVVSAGGGIQAGAWTARALQGLDEQLQPLHLKERLALVSGVSGGSMGALYYGAYRDSKLADGTRQSMESSLDEIASALVGVDHVRRLVGWRVGTDRGAALEASWASRLPKGMDPTLRDWADLARVFAEQPESAAPFPAFLFNSTVVETGQPVGFVTTQFPSAKYRKRLEALKQAPVAESANRLFNLFESEDSDRVKNVGVKMATAARLSATFPYVSPATTLKVAGAKPFHLVDGGYYDNYGFAAVAQWLDDALEEQEGLEQEQLEQKQPAGRKPKTTTVEIVIVQGLVASDVDVVALAEKTEKPPKSDVTSRGWAWQLLAPPAALAETRSFAQWAGGTQVLRLLVEKWSRHGVTIHLHPLDYPADDLPPACREAPLSWKLSKTQQGCIARGWEIVRDRGSELWGGSR